MNNSEIQAILNKRESNVRRLKDFLKKGESINNKPVSALVDKIRKAEEQLLTNGCKLDFTTNEDATFTVTSSSEIVSVDEIESLSTGAINVSSIETTESVSTEEKADTVAEVVEENKASTVKKTRTSKKVAPKKKLRDEDSVSKPENVKIGVTVKESIKSKIDILADDNNMKTNDVVNDLLGRLFDGDKFTVGFEKKEQTKITSFNIPSVMDDALVKLNKKTGIAKTELFNRLLEEALKDFFE